MGNQPAKKPAGRKGTKAAAAAGYLDSIINRFYWWEEELVAVLAGLSRPHPLGEADLAKRLSAAEAEQRKAERSGTVAQRRKAERKIKAARAEIRDLGLDRRNEVHDLAWEAIRAEDLPARLTLGPAELDFIKSIEDPDLRRKFREAGFANTAYGRRYEVKVADVLDWFPDRTKRFPDSALKDHPAAVREVGEMIEATATQFGKTKVRKPPGPNHGYFGRLLKEFKAATGNPSNASMIRASGVRQGEFYACLLGDRDPTSTPTGRDLKAYLQKKEPPPQGPSRSKRTTSQ
jgi:hypothetical protein